MDKVGRDDGKPKLTRTPAVLPLPGLGTMDFLSSLVLKAPATAFENESMALVLRVMWHNHIKKYFIIDTILFLAYFILWIVLVDAMTTSETEKFPADSNSRGVERIVAIVTMTLNSVYGVKELVQSDLGRRSGYFLSMYNFVDISSILFVYVYGISTFVRKTLAESLVPLAVLTTLLLTVVSR